jgi:hypothetical protein
MAGYSLVKIIQDTPEGPYRWEPKAAFDTVAKLYAGFGSGRQVPAAQTRAPAPPTGERRHGG